MSIIRTVLSTSELNRLTQRDNNYFRRRLKDNSMLNNLLNKSINKPLLDELLCVLDRKPMARRKTERHSGASKVWVTKDGKLVRILHANGKVMEQL